MINSPEIFVSYFVDIQLFTGKQSEYIAQLLLKALETKKFIITLDKVSVDLGGKIKDFIRNLEEGKFVVFIFSDKYLKTKSALCEILEAVKNGIAYDKIFVIVLDDVHSFDAIGLINYYHYWDDKITELKRKSVQSLNSFYSRFYADELKFYREISRIIVNFGPFANTFFWNEAQSENIFKQIISTVEMRFEEDVERNSVNEKPKFINNVPHYNVKKYVGKKNLFEKIHKILNTKKHLVFGSHLSGLGRSTTVKAFIHIDKYAKQYDHIAWVSSLENIFQDCVYQLSSELTGFSYNSQQEVSINFKRLMKSLQKISGHNLLVIDDANNPKHLENILEEFEKLNWHVLVTTPYIHPTLNNLTIHHFEKSEAKELFYRHYKKEQNDTVLEYILEDIEYNTMLIELFAKVSQQNRQITTVKLYGALKKVSLGVQISKYKPAITRFLQEENLETVNNLVSEQDILKEEKLCAYISEIYSMEQLSPTEEKYLRYFAILPPLDVDDTFLLDFFRIHKNKEDEFYTSLEILAKRGWIQNHQNTYSMHPLVQIALLQKLKPNSANCFILVNSFLSKLHQLSVQKLKEQQIILPIAENIVRAIQNEDETLALLSSEVGDMFISLEDYQKCMKYKLKALQIKERSLGIDHPEIATYYNDISLIYSYLGNLDKDLEYGLKALDIREKTLQPPHPDLAQSYSNVAISFRSKGKFEKALEYHIKDIEVSEQTFNPFDSNLALSYYETGITCYHLKDYKSAKGFIEKAVMIWKKLLPPDHFELRNAIDIQEIISKQADEIKTSYKR